MELFGSQQELKKKDHPIGRSFQKISFKNIMIFSLRYELSFR